MVLFRDGPNGKDDDADFEVDEAGVRVGGEGGLYEHPRVSPATMFRVDGDVRDVQLVEDVADPDLAHDLIPLLQHEVEGERALELAPPDPLAPRFRQRPGVDVHDGPQVGRLHPAQEWPRLGLPHGRPHGFISRLTSASGSRT